MNLPNWWFAVAYAAGALWLLAWECCAAWVDHEEGDTITEFTRRVLVQPLFWFVALGFLLWVVDHLFFHDNISEWVRRLWR